MDKENISVVTFDEIDKVQFCQMQALAFRELLQQSKIEEDLFSIDHFSWKYNNPFGKAKIATIKQEGKIVASVSMFPVQIIKENNVVTAWNAGDVAVLPDYRGKFFFNQCMNALKQSNTEKDFLFGFPNHNNRSGAKRAGFSHVMNIDFRIKPFFTGIFSKRIEPIKTFSEKQDVYARRIHNESGTMIFRSSEYMNWRYFQKPGTEYFSYSHECNGNVVGNVVARIIKRGNIKVLLIMEYHFINKRAIKFLNRFIGQIAFKNRCFVVIALTTMNYGATSKTGFWELPKWLEPKKMVFWGIALRKEDESLLADNWFIQTGDWDAF